MPERLEVQRAIAAAPEEIFAVLTDPRGHVAIDSSGMLMSADGDRVSKAGDTFTVHMDREALNDFPELGLYDVSNEITAFAQDREIAWTVLGRFNLGHVYGYRLEPIEAGTLATAYYDWSAVDEKMKGIFPVVPESALRATLGILARTVAPGKPRPAVPAA
ncbi:MAG TPA: polyketide cyclase [Trebonia sp.]